jgi:hypothetical protein
MDPEYAEMLKQFFQHEGVTEYLDMTLDDFLEWCMGKTERAAKMVEEALQKHEHKA